MTIPLLALLLGGGLGAICRHLLSLGLRTVFLLPPFWSILVVNLTGCLIIGTLSGLFLRPPHETVRLLLITGFLGSFTTYSTFMLDLVALTEKGMIPTALLYFAIHTLGGFALCFSGLLLGRILIHG